MYSRTASTNRQILTIALSALTVARREIIIKATPHRNHGIMSLIRLNAYSYLVMERVLFLKSRYLMYEKAEPIINRTQTAPVASIVASPIGTTDRISRSTPGKVISALNSSQAHRYRKRLTIGCFNDSCLCNQTRERAIVRCELFVIA